MNNENRTVEQLCEELHSKGAELHDWEFTEEEIHDLSHAIDNAQDLILAAHKRELAEKDDKIEKRNALIKELADILKITSRKYFECEERMCAFCGKKCGRNEANRLIREAREVVK